MDCVLGIDIGTGSVKAVAIDLKGKPFAESQEMYAFSSPKPGYHEQDPEIIWHAFRSCVKSVIEKTGMQPLAAGLSSALHSFVPVGGDCRALAPMMTWADKWASSSGSHCSVRKSPSSRLSSEAAFRPRFSRCQRTASLFP